MTRSILHACCVSWLHLVQTDITRTQYTSAVCEAPPEDEQVMFETCGDSKFLIN
jgi:hypothetical protein